MVNVCLAKVTQRNLLTSLSFASGAAAVFGGSSFECSLPKGLVRAAKVRAAKYSATQKS